MQAACRTQGCNWLCSTQDLNWQTPSLNKSGSRAIASLRHTASESRRRRDVVKEGPMSWKFYGLGVLTVSAVERGGGGRHSWGTPSARHDGDTPHIDCRHFWRRRWLGGGRGQQLSVEVADWQKTKKYSRENCK